MLWVDAICINLEDLKERGHQVRQMGQIYKEAWEVLAWLGDGTGESNVMMDSLSKLQKRCSAIPCS